MTVSCTWYVCTYTCASVKYLFSLFTLKVGKQRRNSLFVQRRWKTFTRIFYI